MKKILITGACGEVGLGLIEKLQDSDVSIIALDINKISSKYKSLVDRFYQVDVSNEKEVNGVFEDHQLDTVYHLAALLSTSAEKNPGRAHVVNAGGTFNLLSNSNQKGTELDKKIKFIFPSTIAVYGISSMAKKNKHKKVKENQYLNPITMYGVNKLYCENLGQYYSAYYSQLTTHKRFLDFRAVRFPGLLSAFTLPTGGTSDYAPEMVHAAARGEPYNCFVRPDTTIGFMAMPDAVEALVKLESADSKKLTKRVYNVSGFSAPAEEFEKEVKKYYPDFKIKYAVDEKRQRIVDSWPMDTDDSLAQIDWSWKPEYNFAKTFSDYLIPNIKY